MILVSKYRPFFWRVLILLTILPFVLCQTSHPSTTEVERGASVNFRNLSVVDTPPPPNSLVALNFEFVGLLVFVYQCVVMIYCFFGIAVVVDDYFVHSLEQISSRFRLSEDVAGATFMAAASSAPELFINVVDVFFGNGTNIGLGTVVGSAMFNILCVVAASALASGDHIFIDWRTLARDCMFYAVSLALLMLVMLGG
eukprot:709528_1